VFDILEIERMRTAIHNWVRKADLQTTSDGTPNQIALDETVIRINDERHWLCAAVDPAINEFLHVRLFSDYDHATHRAVSTRTHREADQPGHVPR
jgi:putative transposase